MNLLDEHGIAYSIPSPGHYKIKCKSVLTIMFYPKSNVIIWKNFGEDRQRRYQNDDDLKIVIKIQSIVEEKK